MTQPVFGHDLSCLTDLTPSMVETDGYTLLAQSLVRRLQTPRGTLIGDPTYGYHIIGEIDDDVTPADVARIGTQIDQEFVKDERVIASFTSVTFSAGALVTQSTVTTAAGPFSLTLGIADIIAILAATPSLAPSTPPTITIPVGSIVTTQEPGPPGEPGPVGGPGPAGPAGGMLTIAIAVGPTAGTYTSSTSIAAGAICRSIGYAPSVGFAAGTTIEVGRTGNLGLLLGTGVFDPTIVVPPWDSDLIQPWGASSLPVIVTIGGPGGSGSGIVYVSYTPVLP
jgi:hypothetical protein